jgi:hypothetical protein
MPIVAIGILGIFIAFDPVDRVIVICGCRISRLVSPARSAASVAPIRTNDGPLTIGVTVAKVETRGENPACWST